MAWAERRRIGAVALGVAAAGMWLCVGPISALARRAGTAATPAVSIEPATQGCFGATADSGKGQIGWDDLRNPILSYPSSAVRDPDVRLVHGQWHLFFTRGIGNGPTWSLATSTSEDLRSWSTPTVFTQPGVLGLASPDVTRRPDGTYVVAYQSDPGSADPPGEAKIYYRTSRDMVRWSPPRRLLANVHAAPGDRLIDPALAWTAHGVILGYKYGTTTQHFEIAWSPSGNLDGRWDYVGRPDITVYGGTLENYQFLPIDGVWHLLATTNNLDRPWLYTMKGSPDVPSGWLSWGDGRELEVPLERWNYSPGINSVNYEQSNGAYLCDARPIDGHFYLFYFGANSLQTYGGYGHTSLGVARSTNLVTWEVPCGSAEVSTPIGCAPG